MKWTYHKIVAMRSPKARIAYSAMRLGKAEVEYRKGQWTCAPEWLAKQGYHPLVFDSFENARRFYESQWTARRFYQFKICHMQIWRVHVRGILLNLPPIAYTWELADCGRITLSPDGYWPLGTVMAKKVKLVECVYKWPQTQRTN